MTGKALRSATSISVVAVLLAFAGIHAAQAQTRDFNVPAQSATTGIPEFARQAGIQILVSEPLVRGKRITTVTGTRSVEEALALLLKGTGLVATSKDGVTYTVAATAPLPTSLNSTAAANTLAASQANSTSVPADQAPAASPANEKLKEELEEVVVTGTHIRGVSPSSPVIIINRSDIERSGYQSTGDVIRNLPESFGGGVQPTVIQAGGSNNPPNQSQSSSANLRGLGSDSTLTLVNGHRLASSDELSVVDVSLIPLPAVERVEILTDGASAIYGSDAVAGVVNFILKKNYDGFQARATVGDSSQGGGELQQYDGLGGKVWETGNAIVSYEYAHQQPIVARQRSFTDPDTSNTSLVPTTNRNSIFASVNQSVNSDVSLFAQGLYTQRSAISVVDLSLFLPGNTYVGFSNSRVEQYGVVGGATLALGSQWHVSLAGDVAHNSTDQPSSTFLNGLLFDSPTQTIGTGLSEVAIDADGPLLTLGSGAVNLAVGASYRRETISDQQTDMGVSTSNIKAQRHLEGLYGELSVPLVVPSDTRTGLHSLMLTAAGRYEHYSDFGSDSIPKIGVIYVPVHDVQLKASWGRSFHAPSLVQQYVGQNVTLESTADPLAPSGSSLILLRFGGNPTLQPETASTTSFNATYRPSWLDGASLDLTYYKISYDQRIGHPTTSFTPLEDPNIGAYTTRNPTAAQIAQVLAVSTLVNQTGQPFDPASVAALVDDRFTNVQSQNANGVDALASYHVASAIGNLSFSVNAAYIDLRQQLLPQTPSQQLSGTVYNPPRFRARAGATWEDLGWTSSVFLNYVGSSSDPTETPVESISAWTSTDAQLGYAFQDARWLSGARILLSAQNLFDKKPPLVTGALSGDPGLHYDSTNASAIGRFISLQLIKNW
jgi:iron complex outermembrane receptor protein